MNKKDPLITIAVILTIIVVLTIGISYAYFSLNVDGEGNPLSVKSAILEIEFSDNTDITLNNAYPSDHSTKTFTVENTGTKRAVYGLVWNISTNTYLYDELVYEYTCTSYKYYGTASQVLEGVCPSKTSSSIPTNNSVAMDNIIIEKDITHVYELTVTFLETGSLQNYNLKASFIGVLEPVENYLWYENCEENSTDIKCTLISKTSASDMPYADNVASPFVTAATGIKFGNISSDTNGKGLYYTTDLSKTESAQRVYYFRGAVENNYLIFGGFCWKIMRTNEDGSVRLFYWGISTDNKCSSVVDPETVNYSNYNATFGDATYGGYMIGIQNQCGVGNDCAGKIRTQSYNEATSNNYDSHIKIAVDNWYETNIISKGTSITSKIANTKYCNDRTIGPGGTYGNSVFTELGYGENNTLFGGTKRIATNGSSGATFNRIYASPQYDCPNDLRDAFTLSVENGGTLYFGNNKLKYPIGLITIDELVYAGGSYNLANTSFFLNFGISYWTMSPSIYNVSTVNIWNLRGSSSLLYNGAGNTRVMIPVISLVSDTNISSGTGLYNDPYIVE